MYSPPLYVCSLLKGVSKEVRKPVIVWHDENERSPVKLQSRIRPGTLDRVTPRNRSPRSLRMWVFPRSRQIYFVRFKREGTRLPIFFYSSLHRKNIFIRGGTGETCSDEFWSTFVTVPTGGTGNEEPKS